MKVYRIVKDKIRANDLSGIGAFRAGGRWNSKGTYMLYTSENSSLAFLEILVHFEKADFPPHLYLMHLELDDDAPIYTVQEKEYSKNWLQLECFENKQLGDKWMLDKRYIGIRVKSAVNVTEDNILLNPLFPGYFDLIRVIDITEIRIDERLVS
jgi:RES domain-containing protein